jgi:hypothetical protein
MPSMGTSAPLAAVIGAVIGAVSIVMLGLAALWYRRRRLTSRARSARARASPPPSSSSSFSYSKAKAPVVTTTTLRESVRQNYPALPNVSAGKHDSWWGYAVQIRGNATPIATPTTLPAPYGRESYQPGRPTSSIYTVRPTSEIRESIYGGYAPQASEFAAARKSALEPAVNESKHTRKGSRLSRKESAHSRKEPKVSERDLKHSRTQSFSRPKSRPDDAPAIRPQTTYLYTQTQTQPSPELRFSPRTPTSLGPSTALQSHPSTRVPALRSPRWRESVASDTVGRAL